MASGTRFAPNQKPMGSPKPKGRVGAESAKDTMCRNVVIYGHCRYEDQGCSFSHDGDKSATSSIESHRRNLNVDSLPFTPAPTTNISLNSPLSARVANAAPFTPRNMTNGIATTPSTQGETTTILNPAHAREFTPQGFEMAMASGANEQHNFDNFNTQHITASDQFNPYNPANYYPPQPNYTVNQPLNYHLYAPQGGVPTDLTPYQRSMSDFFMPEKLREELLRRTDATLLRLKGNLPELEHYHSLVALDVNEHRNSSVFGRASWVYKAQSSQNGLYYCLRRIEGCVVSSHQAGDCIKTWQRIQSAGIVAVEQIFTTRIFKDSSLIFVHEYHPASKTLPMHHLARNGHAAISVKLLWSYIVQLASAISAVHAEGLAVRCLDPSKVIVTGENRVRFSACAILDVMRYDVDRNRPMQEMQQEDLRMFGSLIASIACNFPARLDLEQVLTSIRSQYGAEIHRAIVWLATPNDNHRSINDFLQTISPHIVTCMDDSLRASDSLMSTLVMEAENGRITRLLAKLGTINERHQLRGDLNWAETGIRYQLKLMRDYIFHQVDEKGNPRVDFGHIITCLNKLDAGVDEDIRLISGDEQDIMIVSWKDLKRNVSEAFAELTRTSTTVSRNR